jgi:hypothetical protein
MGPFQLWLHDTLVRGTSVAAFMRTDWGWPTIESAHFIGLTLLFGTIAVWDLRLLGMGKRIPIPEFHRLVPFAVVGFAVNALSGSMFLMTEPDQYLYNPAFHFKIFLVLLAGLNVLVFYAFVFRRVGRVAAGVEGPQFVKIFGAVSLACWIGVIICGRLITFYRPGPCGPGGTSAFIVECIPPRLPLPALSSEDRGRFEEERVSLH